MSGAGRYTDWEKRLAAYIAAVRADVDALGAAPCARFAAGAVEAQTGVDVHAPFAGKYDGELSAAKALRKIGAGDLKSTFDLYFERRESPAFAQRGDVVFNGESVGVCIGADALFIHHDKLVAVPRKHWTIAWAAESAHV
jgi:hypothetical protein